MKSLRDHTVSPELFEGEHKFFLNLSLMVLLAVHFTLRYIGHTYYREDFLDFGTPGAWLLISNALFIGSIVYLNKQLAGWSWSDLGLSRPKNLWQSVFVVITTFTAVILLTIFIRPYFISLGSSPNISHLNILRQDLPMLILALFLVWTTAAFLEELVFRAFMINVLEILLGYKKWAIWVAVLISSLIFGMLHAWQGLSGMLTTASIGLIFGIAYVLNGRRIWALILVHGILDTISLVGIYNS